MQGLVRRARVLFLCTGNSCRSQMAEGWTRHLHPGVMEAYSAGIEAHGLNPRAVAVMKEAGVDISAQRSKLVDELPDVEFDLVVTVCGHAGERCPVFPRKAKIIHAPFDDPPKLAQNARNEQEALDHYRKVRDGIRDFINTLPDLLEGDPDRVRKNPEHNQVAQKVIDARSRENEE